MNEQGEQVDIGNYAHRLADERPALRYYDFRKLVADTISKANDNEARQFRA
jgi:hypothetical protein